MYHCNCLDCGALCLDDDQLNDHIKMHENGEGRRCPVCRFLVGDLEKHHDYFHGELPKPAPITQDEKMEKEAALALFQPKDQKNLNGDIRLAFKRQEWQGSDFESKTCNLCPRRTFSTVQDLLDHAAVGRHQLQQAKESFVAWVY